LALCCRASGAVSTSGLFGGERMGYLGAAAVATGPSAVVRQASTVDERGERATTLPPRRRRRVIGH
jgi:hypothetical protein